MPLMESLSLITLEISTAENPIVSLIWLHGLGADGHDFAPMVGELRLPFQVRFVFPHAPLLPVTMNGGYLMPAWYDLFSLDINAAHDQAGIRNTQAKINALIAHEKQRGVPPDRILLVGFSQGGAIALHTALRYPERLGGVLALSAYLPLPLALADEGSLANKDIPIYMAHGNQDSVISIETARQSQALLVAGGYNVSWHEYDMPHSVCPEEISDMRHFIVNIFGKIGSGS
jgi:phospholipase/carboxylesterase